MKVFPIGLTMIVCQIGFVRHYVKFVEPVKYCASMVLTIMVGYNLKIVLSPFQIRYPLSKNHTI